MPVLIKVTQNKIKDSKAFGKWFGHVANTKTMTYQELCKHMSEHNSVYGEDVCLGVANKLQNCMYSRAESHPNKKQSRRGISPPRRAYGFVRQV